MNSHFGHQHLYSFKIYIVSYILFIDGGWGKHLTLNLNMIINDSAPYTLHRLSSILNTCNNENPYLNLTLCKW